MTEGDQHFEVKVTPSKNEAMDGDSSSEEGKDSCIVRFSTKINSALSNGFYWIGYKTGSYPWTTIFLSLLVTCAFGYGLGCCLESESDPSKLFTPQGTRSLTDKEDVVDNWGNNNRFISLLVTTKSSPLGNVLDKDVLLAGITFLAQARSMSVDVEGYGSVTVSDLCLTVPTPIGDQCVVGSPYGAWNYNPVAITADTDIGATLESYFTQTQLENYFGGVKYLENGKTPSSAKAIRMTLLLINNVTEAGEKDVVAEAWEKALVELTQGTSDMNTDAWDKTIAVYPQSAYSFTKEVGGAISGDVAIVSASYFIIIGFIIFVVQYRCDRVFSTVSVALAGVITIGLGIVSSFGLSGYLGFKFGNTHSILPFIVLGVGADGCFIIVNAFRRTDLNLDLATRAAKALSHAGVSLTVSSITNVVAFGIGSLTVIPDLSSFGKYASFALLFLWLYLCTFYMAVMVINEKRMASNKLDILCCITDCRNPEAIDAVRPKEFVPSPLSVRMRTIYTPFITNNIVRAVIITLTVGFIGFCSYMTTQLTVEATGSNFIPDDSYLKTNFDLQAQYFGGSPTDVQVVVKEFDLAKKVELYGLASKYRFPETYEKEAPYIIPTFKYWMEEFVSDLSKYESGSNTTSFDVDLAEIPVNAEMGSGRFPTDATFYKYLNLWLEDLNGGSTFQQDFIFTDETKSSIKRVRVRMQHAPIGSYNEDGEFKDDASEIVKAMDKMYEITDSFTFAAYPYAFPYTDDWSSFKIIGQELTQNVGLALGSVFVVVSLLIGHPGASLMVFFSTAITIVELLGTNALLGLSIDTVVTVCVVLAVGISVDYSAHIGYGFMVEKGTKVERIGKVLEDVGVPVFHGAISTFLAIALQGISKSYVFRVVFFEFFFAILYSALNGIVLLPIVLSLIGPAPYKSKSS